MFTDCGQLNNEERVSMGDKEQIILEAMTKAGKPVRPDDVAKMTGLESKEISKIISNLKNRAKSFLPSATFMHLVEINLKK